MIADLDTPYGHALPPFPPHSITAHLPGWDTILAIIENPQNVIAKAKSMYPRMVPFGNAKDLIGRIASDRLKPGQMCLLFASRNSAEACREFVLSDNRKENKCEPSEVEIKAFDGHVRLWALCFPATKMPGAVPYWQDPGTGVSSRIAKDVLEHYDSLKEIDAKGSEDTGLSTQSPAFDIVKQRIAGLFDRAPIIQRRERVKAEDVFLYPTGMAAIYQLHRYIQRSSLRPGSTVLFGFAFHSTPLVYKEYSSSFKWFGRGDSGQMKELEEYCTTETNAGRAVQAVWAEFPTNPNVKCVDLKQLRRLADKFGFLLILDDTVSSFCNVDLLDIADVVVTSITKSFSGYADVMGGSVTLNPNSAYYSALKNLCQTSFLNEYYIADVEAMARNSRDYLERSKKLNDNALAIARYLEPFVADSSSAVSAVAYPALGPDQAIYKSFMRPATPEFEAGYGCLLSVELETVEATIAFYDAIKLHKGPHLGATYTLVLPYAKAIHAKDKDWLEECGMSQRMIRVSSGLEEAEYLIAAFKEGVEAAEAVKHKENKDAKDALHTSVNPMG